MIVVAKTSFDRTGKPNRHAAHDLGAASASLSYEAAARGLAVHQMGGFSGERARELFDLPEGSLYTSLVDLKEREPAVLKTGFRRLYEDIR